MSYVYGTNDAFDELLDHIEADTDLISFTMETFGVKFQRAGGHMSRNSVERLTTLFAVPDDWDKVVFNSPVHMYISILGQGEIEDYGECYSDVTTTFQIIIRFDPDKVTNPADVYSTVDAVRNSIRKLDVDSYVSFENGDTSFAIIENGFPAVAMAVNIQHRHGGE